MNQVDTLCAAQAFGFTWLADLPLPHFDAAEPGHSGSDSLIVQQSDRFALRQPLARRERGIIFANGFRFRWDDVVTFDFVAPDRIGYLPGPAWRGELPDCFYSTVAALVAAWHGLLPLHASALEFDGRAFLFAGPAGSGKSTLTAELLERGGMLLGDDLTVLGPGQSVLRGRPAMRLHPDSARRIESVSSIAVPDDSRGKLLLRPRNRSTAAALPLAGIGLLGSRLGPITPAQALRLLPAHLFRPRWSEVLPDHFRRRAWLVELASAVPVLGLAPLTAFSATERASRIESTMRALQAL